LDDATGGFVFNVQGNEEGSRATQVEIIMEGLVWVFPEGGFLREVKEFTFFFFCRGGISGEAGDGIYLG
jgi:hypothetical protein